MAILFSLLSLDVCPACSHVVSPHFHRFEVTEKTHETLMSCLLCGEGTDTASHNSDTLCANNSNNGNDSINNGIVDNSTNTNALEDKKVKLSLIAATATAGAGGESNAGAALLAVLADKAAVAAVVSKSDNKEDDDDWN